MCLIEKNDIPRDSPYPHENRQTLGADPLCTKESQAYSHVQKLLETNNNMLRQPRGRHYGRKEISETLALLTVSSWRPKRSSWPAPTGHYEEYNTGVAPAVSPES